MPLGWNTLVRWLMFGCASALIHLGGNGDPTAKLFPLVLLAGALAIHLLPSTLLASQSFQWSLLIADILMIALGILIVLPKEPVLLATFFLGMLIAILTVGSPGWVIGGFASAGLYLAVSAGMPGGTATAESGLVLRVFFLAFSGYYFLFSMRAMNRTAGAIHAVRMETPVFEMHITAAMRRADSGQNRQT